MAERSVATTYWTSSRILALSTVLLAAAVMRPAIVAFGPVAARIGDELGLPPATLGVLAALPVFAFGLVSAFVAIPAKRLGFDRVVALALVTLALGTAMRLLPGSAAMWVGTALVGVGIATLNVLLPAIVKRDFPDRASAMTGLYSSVLVTAAATAVFITAPITTATGGDWRLALAASMPLTLAALGLAAVRAAGARRAEGGSVAATTAEVRAVTTVADPGARRSVWRSPLAWAVTAYMGLQSTLFYTFVNWMPSIEQSVGVDESLAGTHLALAQIVGMPVGLLAGALMNRRRDHRIFAAGIMPLGIVGLLGMILIPAGMVWWVLLFGLVTGVLLPVALALISERTSTAAEAASLSGMSQSAGYFVAGLGPFVGGALYAVTGDWNSVLWMLVVVAALVTVAGLIAGRDRRI